jgi:hypothetical protein
MAGKFRASFPPDTLGRGPDRLPPKVLPRTTRVMLRRGSLGRYLGIGRITNLRSPVGPLGYQGIFDS